MVVRPPQNESHVRMSRVLKTALVVSTAVGPVLACAPRDVARLPRTQSVSVGATSLDGKAVTAAGYTTHTAGRVAFDGTVKHSGHQWRFVPRAYGTPAFSVADSELVSIDVVSDTGFSTAAAVLGTVFILGTLGVLYVFSQTFGGFN